MISATGARKLSKKASKMEMVESKIKEAAKKGEREVKIRTFFYGEEKKFLEELGYQVDEDDRGGYTKISW